MIVIMAINVKAPDVEPPCNNQPRDQVSRAIINAPKKAAIWPLGLQPPFSPGSHFFIVVIMRTLGSTQPNSLAKVSAAATALEDARIDFNNENLAKHIVVPLSKKKTDGPYGPSKPYIKIGIYRIGDTGTTSFAYNNLVIKNKKK